MFGQPQSNGYAEAEDLFARNRFTAAWPYYDKLLKTDPLNPDLNFKMGVCYLNSRSQKEKAISCFQKAIVSTDKETDNSIITYKLLADACYYASNFDQAIINYEKYKKILLDTKASQLAIEEITEKIKMCHMAKELKELKELTLALIDDTFDYKNKKDGSAAFNYSTTTSADQASITFTLSKTLNNGIKIRDGDFYENSFTVLSNNPAPASNRIDTSSIQMESTVATSVDGQILLIYRDDNGEGNLYAARLNGNEWRAAEKLNKAINNNGWEPNEFISADGNTLYFSSSREGGFGGKDIYRSIKLTNGEWGKAINMGPTINTIYDEEAPCIHPDGVTLFFSSNRYRTKSVFDNFISTLTDSGWTTPVNVGYPLNKNTITEQLGGKKLKVLSEKEKVTDEKDNYRVTFIDPKKIPVTMIKGKIIDREGKIPGYAEITVTDNETGEITGVYHADGNTGKYMFILPPGKNNNITYEAEGYLFHSENLHTSKETSFYKAHNTVELVPLAEESKVVLNNIFFADSSATLSAASEVELNRILNFLMLNPKMAVEILMFTDKEKTKRENELANDKAQAVVNYLIQKGVAKENVASRLSEKPKKLRKKKIGETITENESGKLELKIIALK